MATMTLNDLVSRVREIYGNELVAVALYGSAARGEHIERHSDLNVLVVVDQLTMDHLRRESPVARAWREAGNPPPLTLTRSEWIGSADIFPIEYADILAHHKVLHGSLPLDQIKVSRSDMRLQLEHEAMSKLLRLRHAVLIAAGDRPALRELLERSSSTMMVLLRATLRMHGEEPALDSDAVCVRVAEVIHIDASPVRRILRHTRGRELLSDVEAEALVEPYLNIAKRLAVYLDAYADGE